MGGASKNVRIFDVFEAASHTSRLAKRMSKLYVGNVPEGAKEKELKELFEAFGSVEEVALLRGYGFVVSFVEERSI